VFFVSIINVSSAHFILNINIKEALYMAEQEGLRLLLAYNCGGYEKVETMSKLLVLRPAS